MARAGPFQRFYKAAAVAPAGEGFAVLLDGRGLRTPKGNRFEVPTRPLAEAIAQEWQSQGDTVDPQSMPLTGLANAAIDHVAPEVGRFVEQISAYGASDLLCYRAEAPLRLTQRQQSQWDPLLEWVAARYGARFRIAAGVMPCRQDPEAMAQLKSAIAAMPPFALAALFSAVTLTGSLVLGLAIAEGRLSAAEAWAVARLDEVTQAEDWGLDAEAEARAQRMGAELAQAERFLRLLG